MAIVTTLVCAIRCIRTSILFCRVVVDCGLPNGSRMLYYLVPCYFLLYNANLNLHIFSPFPSYVAYYTVNLVVCAYVMVNTRVRIVKQR